MNKSKRLVMDMDYFDLAWHGYGRRELEGLFDRCARAGITAMVWSVLYGGRSQYPSKILPLYNGEDLRQGSRRVAELLRSFDPVATAVELGRKHGIQILAYYRMYDHYYPGWYDQTIDRMEHGWWESRCGRFQLKGWPCYAEPEVRDYSLRLVREIADLGVDGFMFGLTRSHSLYVMPYRQPNFFGYNRPIADEYQKRYGVDIRQFDYCEDQMVYDGYLAKSYWPFLNEVQYMGATEFDLAQWHWLKNEGNTAFFREARTMLGPSVHLAMEAAPGACPPLADPNDPSPVKFYVDPAALAREGLINEWIVPGNFRNVDIEAQLLPAFQGVRDAGAEINLWLNDIFVSDGGAGQAATADEVQRYLERFAAGPFAAATIHEADFLEQNPEADQIWSMMADRFGKNT